MLTLCPVIILKADCAQFRTAGRPLHLPACRDRAAPYLRIQELLRARSRDEWESMWKTRGPGACGRPGIGGFNGR